MTEQNDIIQRIYFDLQWGTGGGGQTEPSEYVTAQTGDPLLLIICALLLAIVVAGIVSFIFRNQIAQKLSMAINSASVNNARAITKNISIAIIAIIVSALCIIAIVSGRAYADNSNKDEWNYFTPHIDSTAYLNPDTGDITFDIPVQTSHYADQAIINDIGFNSHVEGQALWNAWWDVYIDDYCVWSFYNYPLKISAITAIVGKYFKISVVIHNVDVNELSSFVGQDFVELFYTTVDPAMTPYWPLQGIECSVDINELEIADQAKFDEFCINNDWTHGTQTPYENLYVKFYGVEDFTKPISIISDPWNELVYSGVLKTKDNLEFNKFDIRGLFTAPVNSLLQTCIYVEGPNLEGLALGPLYNSSEMVPLTLTACSDFTPLTEQGYKEALNNGWYETSEGLTKLFPGNLDTHEVVSSIPVSWFDLTNNVGLSWQQNYGSAFDVWHYNNGALYNTGMQAICETIQGTVVDENNQPLKDVIVCNNTKWNNPEESESWGIYIPECDITDENGHFKFYYPVKTQPVIYCNDLNKPNVMPDVTSDYTTISDRQPHNFNNLVAYKASYINVGQKPYETKTWINYKYVTTDEKGQEHTFYCQKKLIGKDEPILVPAGTKGFLLADDDQYQFMENEEIQAPAWGQKMDIIRTIIPKPILSSAVQKTDK